MKKSVIGLICACIVAVGVTAAAVSTSPEGMMNSFEALQERISNSINSLREDKLSDEALGANADDKAGIKSKSTDESAGASESATDTTVPESSTETTTATTTVATTTTTGRSTTTTRRVTTTRVTTTRQATTTTTKKTTTVTSSTSPVRTPIAGRTVGYENEMLSILNSYRAAAGRPALKLADDLNYLASVRAEEISRHYTANHTRPDGRSWQTIVQEIQDNSLKNYSNAGENIAYGQTTVSRVMTDWYNSEGHRNNMLSTNFTHVGFGCCIKNGTRYWAQLFLGVR